MAYRLEHIDTDHQEVLRGTLMDWSKSEHDIYLVSDEGHWIFTQKIFLYFYSCNLGPVLDSLPPTTSPPGISVKASSSGISNLLRLLTTGETPSQTKNSLAEVLEAASALGIKLENCLLQSKRGPNSQVTIKKLPAKTEIISSKTSSANFSVLKNKDSGTPPIPNLTKKWNTVIVAQNKITRLPSVRNDIKKIKTEKTDDEKVPEEGNSVIRKDPENSDVLELKCDLCSKIFSGKRNLRRHKFRKHQISMRSKKGRPKSNSDLNISTDDVKIEKAESVVDVKAETAVDVKLPCNDCEKEFDSKKKLSRHMLQHTNNFTCDQCEKSFPSNASLRLHKNIHLEEKPFKCDECDKGFAQAGNLKTHKSRYHNGDNTLNSSNLSDSSSMVVEEVDLSASLAEDEQRENASMGISRDKCGYCDEHFDDPAELNSHMILMHSIQQMIQDSE